jgi:hypothetical protein
VILRGLWEISNDGFDDWFPSNTVYRINDWFLIEDVPL